MQISSRTVPGKSSSYSILQSTFMDHLQVRQGKWDDAIEMLGDTNPFQQKGMFSLFYSRLQSPIHVLAHDGPAIPSADTGIKVIYFSFPGNCKLTCCQVEASMCHLRGILMLKLNRGDQAKQCFMEALALDVKCYESFEQLMSGEMMTPDEGISPTIAFYFFALTTFSLEWEFIQGLAYSSQTPQDAQFVQLIYTARLRKHKHATEHALTRQRLVEEYGLGDNPDVLYSFADSLYASFRFADCFVITSRFVHSSLETCAVFDTTNGLESSASSRSITKRCHCISHACTTYRTSIPNFSFWPTKWWIENPKIQSAGMLLVSGTLVAKSGHRLGSTLGRWLFFRCSYFKH